MGHVQQRSRHAGCLTDRGCVSLQKFINTGDLAVDIPYTLAIHSPTYVLVQNSWNWGVSGSANDGTFSGAVSMVRLNVA